MNIINDDIFRGLVRRVNEDDTIYRGRYIFRNELFEQDLISSKNIK